MQRANTTEVDIASQQAELSLFGFPREFLCLRARGEMAHQRAVLDRRDRDDCISPSRPTYPIHHDGCATVDGAAQPQSADVFDR
jgi:hypothetical protein